MEKGMDKGVDLTFEIVNMLKAGKSVAAISKELNIEKRMVLKVKKLFGF